ncbi:MAG: hypothetical protein U0R65_09240 [Candidatus Nanopelagicales bacterium]
MSLRSRISPVIGLTLISTLLAGAVAAPSALAATGDVTSFALPGGSSGPAAITSVSGGDLWIALRSSGSLASMTTAGVATARPVAGLAANSAPSGITQDGAGRIWFTEQYGNAVSSVNTSAADLKRLQLPKTGSGPTSITLGPDGNLWFTENGGDRIGKVTPAGVLTEYDLPAGAAPTAIAANKTDWLAFTMPGKNAIGKITTSGTITTTTLPSAGSSPRGIAVDGNGSVWFTEFGVNRIGRLATSGALAEFGIPTSDTGPTAIAIAPDGTAWFAESKTSKVARITGSGAVTEYALGAVPLAITAGSDGNMWVTDQSNRVSRILTGSVPTNTAVPTISGSSTAPGSVLTAANGSWTNQPTTYSYQWQRCTTNNAASCTDIAGATANTYTIVAADAGTWLRVTVKAANANGGASSAAASALLQMGAKPIPAPVTGSPSATIAPGVTATLVAVNKTKRKVLRSFRVTYTSGDIRGKARITLVNAAGTEVLVIAKGKWARSTGPTSISKRWKRIPTSVPRGTYTLKAVFTPHPSLTSTYAVATLTRPITIR